MNEQTRTPPRKESFEDLSWKIAKVFGGDKVAFCVNQLRIPLTEIQTAMYGPFSGSWFEGFLLATYKRNGLEKLMQAFSKAGERACIKLLSESENGMTSESAVEATQVSQFIQFDRRNPLETALQTRQSANVTTAEFLFQTNNHFLSNILSVMDETSAWKKLLSERGLLNSPEMETYVAKLSQQWDKSRDNRPSLQVLKTLSKHNSEFAQGNLHDFAKLLLRLQIDQVTTEVVKLTSWLDEKKLQNTKKSETAYQAQDTLRSWLLGNSICDKEDVGKLIVRLRKEGVKGPESIQWFDKTQDLKALGFTTLQAMHVLQLKKK